jgi:EAL domain-containing protein (putative c-di-GMP-specific phosphodiesterase class I)
MGCHFALDDFGSGLSSFTYLKHFAVDYIKIDGSFVRSIESDAIDRTLVEAIGKVARNMGICSIAEHLETEGARTTLREAGIDYAQGFLIQPPRPLAIAEQMR